MSINVAKNRLIVPSLVTQYRPILGNISNIIELGKHLTLAAETAQAMQQTDTVRECGLILSNLPVKEYQLIGQYYLGWCAWCNGANVSTSLFENIFDQSKTYKAKSLITLGALAGAKGNLEEEMWYHTEALRHSDFATSIRIRRVIAIVKSREGFHRSSLRDLENLYPVMKYAPPHIYFDYLNSLAVELAECDRLEEARNITKITCSSPLIVVYPCWRETSEDIERKGYRSSRSFVPIVQGVQQNIVRLPERENTPVSQGEPGRVLHFDWEAMVKKRNNEGDEAIDAMDEKELLVKLVQLTALEDVDTNKLRRIVKYAIKVMNEK